MMHKPYNSRFRFSESNAYLMILWKLQIEDIERLKKSDKEYRTTLESGDYQKAAELANMLVLMAKEVIYDCMVYV